MALQIAGQTVHFTVQYDDAFGAQALAVANAVVALCELDLSRLSVHMPYHSGNAGDPFLDPKIAVQVINNPLNGPGFSAADNNGFSIGKQSLIRINAFSAPGVPITADYAGYVFIAELSELIMGFYGWDAASSQGEGLSRVMAEELHPASTSNYVNLWLGWARPRPDFVSRDEPASPLLIVRGDLDPIAYGCSMIFIYFLRYQLGFTYFQIVGAGGSLLSDRYRNLTGATDDPAMRVGALLDSHFGTGDINLVSNNPFPLYEGAERRVLLAFGQRTEVVNHPLPDGGSAHVRPYFSCPAADYPYTEIGSSVTLTITATTVGIGFPKFNWRINGTVLISATQSGVSIASPVDVPDPQDPGNPKHQNQPFTFDYQIQNVFNASGGSSALTITSQCFVGDYQIQLHADADETAVPGVPVVAEQSIKFHTRTVVYGGNYAADQQRCVRAFEKAVSGKLHSLQVYVDLLRDRPDPADPGYLTRVLEAVDQIRQQVTHLAVTDHATATKLAQYAANRTGVPANLFLKGVHGVSSE